MQQNLRITITMSSSIQSNKKPFLSIKETALFAVFGALMYTSKMLMEFLPNIHLLGLLIMLFTVVYRKKALIPIYLYVFLDGLTGGFSLWWLPYLYIWAVLWGATMLLPKRMPDKIAAFVFPIVCGLHGLLFGTLYAPLQALLYRYDFKTTVAWIIAGLPYDGIHALSNLTAGTLILPLSKLLIKINKKYNI